MIYHGPNGETLCFRHAVLRVSKRGERVEEESKLTYRSGCVDCAEESRMLDELQKKRREKQ